MALVVDNYHDMTYSLVINSNDRISGTNNNATFQINWRDFLPDKHMRYKIAFTFQTTGGYYTDGYYTTAASRLSGYTVGTAFSAGTNTISVTGSPINSIVANMFIGGPGIASGTQVISNSSGSILLSQPTYGGASAGSALSFYNVSDVSAVTFSAARIVFNTSSRSYSFDTSTKAPSTNLGVVQRDIQTSQSKSNTLSAFYCQNPPRIIARPEANLLTISLYNNGNFFGANNNLLTDTNTTTSLAADMTPWTMLLEFIPIS